MMTAAPPIMDRWRLSVGEFFPKLAWPLFWHEPPWYRISRELAQDVARQAATFGIAVSALAAEIGIDELANRICPYRPDRFGLKPSDLDRSIIDLRLTAMRNEDLNADYLPCQLKRWCAFPEHVHADQLFDIPHWPADIRSLDDLVDKVHQLRTLGRNSAVWVTAHLDRIEALSPSLTAARVDGVIIQSLASDLRNLPSGISRLREQAPESFRIGIVADIANAEDLAICFALGADLVAVDTLLNPLIIEPVPPPQAPTSYLLGPPVQPAPTVPKIDITSALTQLTHRLVSVLSVHGARFPRDPTLSLALRKR
jgi:hypothetical protein